jgi:hypothetical protein
MLKFKLLQYLCYIMGDAILFQLQILVYYVYLWTDIRDFPRLHHSNRRLSVNQIIISKN